MWLLKLTSAALFSYFKQIINKYYKLISVSSFVFASQSQQNASCLQVSAPEPTQTTASNLQPWQYRLPTFRPSSCLCDEGAEKRSAFIYFSTADQDYVAESDKALFLWL